MILRPVKGSRSPQVAMMQRGVWKIRRLAPLPQAPR
jgi:hypothetical protein